MAAMLFQRLSLISALLLAPVFVQATESIIWFDRAPSRHSTPQPVQTGLAESSSLSVFTDMAEKFYANRLPISSAALFGRAYELSADTGLLTGRLFSLFSQGAYDETLSLLANTPQNANLSTLLPLYRALEAEAAGNIPHSMALLRDYQQNGSTGIGRTVAGRLYNKLQRQQNETPATNKAPLRVGLLVPQSGTFSQIGLDMLKAAQLALFEHSNSSEHILLYPQDSGDNPLSAQDGAGRLLEQNIHILLGPVQADQLSSIYPLIRNTNIPIFGFSSAETLDMPEVTLFNYPLEDQVRHLVDYALSQGKTRFAALIPDTAYGKLAFEHFFTLLRKIDLPVDFYEFFDPTAADISPVLERLTQMERARKEHEAEQQVLQKAFDALGNAMDDVRLARLKELKSRQPEPIVDFDALFLPAAGSTLPLLASQLAFFDLDTADVTILAPQQSIPTTLNHQTVPYLKQFVFSRGSQQGMDAFNQRFKQSYGSTPHPLAILAYDMMRAVMESTVSNGFESYRSFYENILREEGFNGSGGSFKFTDNNTLHRRYDLVRLNPRGTYETLYTAPAFHAPYLPLPRTTQNNWFGGNRRFLWD